MVNRPLPGATEDYARARRDLLDYGYCIIANALAPWQAACLRQRLEEQAWAERERGLAYEIGGVRKDISEDIFVRAEPDAAEPRHQIVGVLINKGRVFRDLFLQEWVDEVAGALLGEDFLLSSYDASIVRPRGPVMAMHTDQWWMPRPQVRNEAPRPAGNVKRGEYYGAGDENPKRPITPPGACTAMWMLSDFTSENGATRVVPCSHLSGEQPDPGRDYGAQSVPIVGSAGTAFLWDARTWHGMGANVSDSERVAIVCTFCAPMFRQQINFTLGTRPYLLHGASDKMLTRLGFKVWGGVYGRLRDGDEGFVSVERDVIGELPQRDTGAPEMQDSSELPVRPAHSGDAS